MYDFNRTIEATNNLGSTAVATTIEAIAFNACDDKLYGCYGGIFVKIDKSDGSITVIGDIDDVNPFTGSDGNLVASDVDGLEKLILGKELIK